MMRGIIKYISQDSSRLSIKTSIEGELKFIWINNDVSNATTLHEVRKEN